MSGYNSCGQALVNSGIHLEQSLKLMGHLSGHDAIIWKTISVGLFWIHISIDGRLVGFHKYEQEGLLNR